MRTYDVFRRKDLVARVRIGESGIIEWAYRQEQGEWQGFWWNNTIKSNIDQIIAQYPELQELEMSHFTLRRCGI